MVLGKGAGEGDENSLTDHTQLRGFDSPSPYSLKKKKKKRKTWKSKYTCMANDI